MVLLWLSVVVVLPEEHQDFIDQRARHQQERRRQLERARLFRDLQVQNEEEYHEAETKRILSSYEVGRTFSLFPNQKMVLPGSSSSCRSSSSSSSRPGPSVGKMHIDGSH